MGLPVSLSLVFGLAVLGMGYAVCVSDAKAEDRAVIRGYAMVIDGDTLLMHGRKVRLFGMDAPEIDQQCHKQERGPERYACGLDAKRMLREMTAGKTITCVVHARDTYKRMIAKCFVDGQDVSAVMVSQGMAVAYFSTFYNALEQTARTHKRGLWGGRFVKPSAYRRLHNTKR